MEIAFPADARPYLEAQKGALWDLRGDRAAWDAAYGRALAEQLASLKPWLPAKCERILDVGSGLGGIDILLAKTTGARIWLLDGEACPPEVQQHRKPFSHMGVARRFLKANGVALSGHYSPETATPDAPARSRFDLVVSFGAWCFHFEPELYLDFVRARLNPGARLILEVRNNKPQWRAALGKAFRQIGVAAVRPKFTRLVYEA